MPRLIRFQRFKPGPIPRRKKIKWLVIITVLLIAIWLFKSWQKPAVGTISYPQSPGQSQRQDIIHFTGKYFELNYPSNFKPNKQNTKSMPSAMESYNFTADDNEAKHSKIVAVTISNLEDANLDNDPNYKYRITYPKLYDRRVTNLNGNTAYFFTRHDSEELTVFIQRSSLLATIGLTGFYGDSRTESEFNIYLNSWQWR